MPRKNGGSGGAYKMTMLSLMDIWRRAVELRGRFGEEAAVVAGENGERCLDSGDMDGFCNWSRILQAVAELERPFGTRDSMH